MEFALFWGGAFVVAVYLIWRVRRGTSSDLASRTKGLPDDLRDKNSGLDSFPSGGFGDGGGGG